MIGHVKINYGPENMGCKGGGLFKICFRSFLVHREVLWKIEIFKNTSRWCTILAIGTMIGHVKINYGPKNQRCTPFTGGVLLKICFRSFLVHREVLWKIEIFSHTSRWCTTLAFGTMIGHVKINYGSENQGCTPFTDGVLLKICFRSI